MNRRIIALLCVVAASSSVASGQESVIAPPAAFAGIPDVTFDYYEVSGQKARDIRKSINAQRPRDPNDNQAVDALNRWHMRWRWRSDGKGGCDLATAEVSFSATVRMPRHSGEANLPTSLRGKWRTYMTALETHEAGHVRYAYDHVGDVLAAIRGATCTTAGAAGRAAVAEIAKHDIAYDRKTRHGATQGAVFP